MPNIDKFIGKDFTNVLASTELFRSLDTTALTEFLSLGNERTLAKGDALFTAGDSYHNEVYLLVSGELEVTRAENRATIPEPGYLVGLSSYLSHSNYASTASAETTVKLLAIPADKLRQYEEKYPAFFDALNSLIAKLIRERTLHPAPEAGPLVEAIRNFMSQPIISCSSKTSIKQAFVAMQQHNISALAIIDDNSLSGYINTTDITLGLLDESKTTVLARDIIRPAVTIDAGAPLWSAEETLESTHQKHLIVIENERPVGLLSQTDILRALSNQHIFMHNAINSCNSIDELRTEFGRIPAIANDLLSHNKQAHLAVRSLSKIHLKIQRRCTRITMESLVKDGLGEPPVDFAFIIMGSGGRHEMLLNPDQDNGLILSDYDEDESDEVTSWFKEFSKRVTLNLDRIGYPLCKGDIMATNPMYSKSLSQWKSQMDNLTRHPNEKSARWSNIFFDFHTLYGDSELTRELWTHLIACLEDRPRLLEFMVTDDAEGTPAINWLNQLVTDGKEDGKIDLKRNGLRIFTNAARILALKYGIQDTDTNLRLTQLHKHGVISRDFLNTLLTAHDELLDLTLSNQIEKQRKKLPLDKKISSDEMHSASRESLRVAMRAVKRFQDFLQGQIGTISYLS